MVDYPSTDFFLRNVVKYTGRAVLLTVAELLVSVCDVKFCGPEFQWFTLNKCIKERYAPNRRQKFDQ